MTTLFWGGHFYFSDNLSTNETPQAQRPSQKWYFLVFIITSRNSASLK